MTSTTRTVAAALLAPALIAGLTACGTTPGAQNGPLPTVAAFYPLQFALQEIGGSNVGVTSLTKPGVEPHDLELTPQQVASIADAKVTVYLRGFQSSVDDAVSSSAPKGTAFDVAPSADMTLKLTDTSSVGSSGADDHAGHSHGTDEHAHKDEHEHDSHGAESGVDPHFWLDPVRYKKVAQSIGTELARVDPAHKAAYTERTKAFTARLDALNNRFRTGLAKCQNSSLVTGHAAFGYLADRYGLSQVGVAGVSPEAEPTPARLKAIASYAKEHHVTTIYSETLVSPKTAQTVAKQTGAQVKVLDPLEGLTDASAGKNYFEVMDSNLATLKAGQRCS